MRPDWYQDWSGDVAAVVASGSSVRQYDVDLLRGKCRVAVVNNSWELAPWADVLYAADRNWWEEYHGRASAVFGGQMVSPDAPVAKRFGLRLVGLLPESTEHVGRISLEPGVLGRGGNSGFQCLNLVVQFGARRVILLGFDFCGDHWHGEHKSPLRNAQQCTMDKWAGRLDAASSQLRDAGVDVILCSGPSLLNKYRRSTVPTVIGEWFS